MRDTYIREAQARMRRCGVFLQAVVPNSPLDVPYVYSAGFQRLDPAAPEVIVLGLADRTAGGLANAVFEQVRSGVATLEPGALLTGLAGFDPKLRLRIDPALPRWVDSYALLARDLLRAEQVPFVQLVWPDDSGRWPDDPKTGSELRASQPLLARDPAWLAPIAHTPGSDWFMHHAVGDDLVAMPVFDGLRPEGRWEVLAAQSLDEGRAVIGQVPWLADYAAYGDVVGVRPSEPADCVGSALVGGAVLEAGGRRTITYHLRRGRGPEGDRLAAALDRISAEPLDARVSSMVGSVHINAADCEQVRTALRPFARDGVIVEVEQRSSVALVPPDGGGLWHR